MSFLPTPFLTPASLFGSSFFDDDFFDTRMFSLADQHLQSARRQLRNASNQAGGHSESNDPLSLIDKASQPALGPAPLESPSGGVSTSHNAVEKSVLGSDGKWHSQRYQYDEMLDHSKGLQETRHAFTDGSTGKRRLVIERHIGDRGSKIVKESDESGSNSTHNFFVGMDEQQAALFDEEWNNLHQQRNAALGDQDQRENQQPQRQLPYKEHTPSTRAYNSPSAESGHQDLSSVNQKHQQTGSLTQQPASIARSTRNA